MKKKLYPFLSCLAIAWVFNACFVMDNKFSAIAPGRWRAVLQLDSSTITPNKKGEPLPEKLNMKFEPVTKGELPFLFDVTYTDDSTFVIDIINGTEKIRVDAEDITYGRNRKNGRDTVLIKFPIYDTYIRAIFQERVMEGEWVNPNKNISIPFRAEHGRDYRFTVLNNVPKNDISGDWEASIGLDDSIPEKAVAEFKQQGTQLSGTFRTETGDYRFLDGTILANKKAGADKFYLSCFDGTHAYLFEGVVNADGSLLGIYQSGKTYKTTWSAKRNKDFQLRGADTLTFLKKGYDSMAFSFQNAEGKTISLNDKQFERKAKVIQILGTWCPNCRDETKFLTEYVKKNPNLALSVVGLSFERKPEKAVQQVKIYKEKMQVPYEVLIAGTSTNKEEAAKALPMLNHILSYPTTIFVDKKNKVRKILTGFDGPATSKYEAYTQEFDKFVQELAKE